EASVRSRSATARRELTSAHGKRSVNGLRATSRKVVRKLYSLVRCLFLLWQSFINVNISVYTFAYIRMYNLAYYMFGLGQTYNKSFSLTALPSFLVLFFLLNMIFQTI